MYEFLAFRVAEFMTADVVTLDPDASVRDAEALLAEHDVDAFTVCGAACGELVGVLSKLDILRAYHFTPEAEAR